MTAGKISEKSNVLIKGVSLAGRILVIDLIKDLKDLDPEADLHVAPLVEAGKLVSLSDLKKNNKVTLLHRIWRSVCLGMHYIHGLGYVHGLLTPDRIVWDSENKRILIPEWNISGLVPGPRELLFCPPELLGDKKISGAADIYFLAAILFFIETGETVHPGDTQGSLKENVQKNILCSLLNTQDAENHDDINRVVAKGLKTVPSDRYSTAMELLEASAPILESTPPQGLWPVISSALITWLAIVGASLWFLVWMSRPYSLF